MSRNAIRDFFRRRRVERHLAAHGPVFDYHGLPVTVSREAGLSAMNALLKGKYERDEAALIVRHLPPDLPVIELGGSLGVVSRLIRSRLKPDTPHVVVEANADLIETCTMNAQAGAAPGATTVIEAALHHGGPVARFRIGGDIHSNAVDRGDGGGVVREVPAVTLAELVNRLGSPGAFALVCDIEGAEFEMFEKDGEALSRAAVAIVELHPRAYASAGTHEADLIAAARRAGLAPVERSADVVVFKSDRSRPDPRP